MVEPLYHKEKITNIVNRLREIRKSVNKKSQMSLRDVLVLAQQALAQIALQATFHTICEICHPILLFGTILLLNLCDLPPYTLIWHYMFIRHTRVMLPVQKL